MNLLVCNENRKNWDRKYYTEDSFGYYKKTQKNY